MCGGSGVGGGGGGGNGGGGDGGGGGGGGGARELTCLVNTEVFCHVFKAESMPMMTGNTSMHEVQPKVQLSHPQYRK